MEAHSLCCMTPLERASLLALAYRAPRAGAAAADVTAHYDTQLCALQLLRADASQLHHRHSDLVQLGHGGGVSIAAQALGSFAGKAPEASEHELAQAVEAAAALGSLAAAEANKLAAVESGAVSLLVGCVESYAFGGMGRTAPAGAATAAAQELCIQCCRALSNLSHAAQGSRRRSSDDVSDGASSAVKLAIGMHGAAAIVGAMGVVALPLPAPSFGSSPVLYSHGARTLQNLCDRTTHPAATTAWALEMQDVVGQGVPVTDPPPRPQCHHPLLPLLPTLRRSAAAAAQHAAATAGGGGGGGGIDGGAGALAALVDGLRAFPADAEAQAAGCGALAALVRDHEGNAAVAATVGAIEVRPRPARR